MFHYLDKSAERLTEAETRMKQNINDLHCFIDLINKFGYNENTQNYLKSNYSNTFGDFDFSNYSQEQLVDILQDKLTDLEASQEGAWNRFLARWKEPEYINDLVAKIKEYLRTFKEKDDEHINNILGKITKFVIVDYTKINQLKQNIKQFGNAIREMQSIYEDLDNRGLRKFVYGDDMEDPETVAKECSKKIDKFKQLLKDCDNYIETSDDIYRRYSDSEQTMTNMKYNRNNVIAFADLVSKGDIFVEMDKSFELFNKFWKKISKYYYSHGYQYPTYSSAISKWYDVAIKYQSEMYALQRQAFYILHSFRTGLFATK